MTENSTTIGGQEAQEEGVPPLVPAPSSGISCTHHLPTSWRCVSPDTPSSSECPETTSVVSVDRESVPAAIDRCEDELAASIRSQEEEGGLFPECFLPSGVSVGFNNPDPSCFQAEYEALTVFLRVQDFLATGTLLRIPSWEKETTLFVRQSAARQRLNFLELKLNIRASEKGELAGNPRKLKDSDDDNPYPRCFSDQDCVRLVATIHTACDLARRQRQSSQPKACVESASHLRAEARAKVVAETLSNRRPTSNRVIDERLLRQTVDAIHEPEYLPIDQSRPGQYIPVLVNRVTFEELNSSFELYVRLGRQLFDAAQEQVEKAESLARLHELLSGDTSSDTSEDHSPLETKSALLRPGQVNGGRLSQTPSVVTAVNALTPPSKDKSASVATIPSPYPSSRNTRGALERRRRATRPYSCRQRAKPKPASTIHGWRVQYRLRSFGRY